MTRSIRVAAVQLRAHDRALFARTIDAIAAAAEEACNGADLVVLPESTFPAYVLGDPGIEDAAVEATISRLCDLARRTSTVIVIGAAVRDGESLRNAAVVIDRDGTIAGRADKLFLWHFDRRWFTAGEALEPVPTALGSLGVLVCADGRLPTIARALVDRGADVLVMPTAWVTSGRQPAHLENVQADLLARVRAFENGVPFVAANKCGSELGMVLYCGKSQIVDAHGTVTAIASERDPEILRAAIEIGAGRPFRAKPAQPPPRKATLKMPFRVGISLEALPSNVQTELDWLDDAHAITPAPADRERFARLDGALPAAFVNDAEVLDPAGLVGYRRAGYQLVVWVVENASPWVEAIARARALELRVYVVVFDGRAGRAFAVDPDGVVIAGTFDDFRLASFVLDPRRTTETSVAPGTDIAEGLELVASIVERSDGTLT